MGPYYSNHCALVVKSIFQFISRSIYGLSTLFCVLGVCVPSWAQKVSPSPTLSEPTASASAYSGLGVAAPGDYSSFDVNPALGPALKKQYLVFGDFIWQQNAHLISGGIFDNTTTSVGTVVRVRESLPVNGDSRDRRFTLGLSYQIPQTHLSFGLTTDYEQLSVYNMTSSIETNVFLGTGAFYELFSGRAVPLFLGVSTNRLFDTYGPSQYNVGLAASFLNGFYVVSADTLSSERTGLTKVGAGLHIAANSFFDLKGSYGYLTKDRKNVWGAGFFFHAPILQVFYTVSRFDGDAINTFHQTAGCGINLTL